MTTEEVRDALIAKIQANNDRVTAICRDPNYTNPDTHELLTLHKDRQRLISELMQFKETVRTNRGGS